jgi:hypothetical protein
MIKRTRAIAIIAAATLYSILFHLSLEFEQGNTSDAYGQLLA